MNNGFLKLAAVILGAAMLIAAFASLLLRQGDQEADGDYSAQETTAVSCSVSSGSLEEAPPKENPQECVELTVLAAASLTDVCNELKTRFEAQYPSIRVTLSYGASGALQTQIEEGAPADVFLSAATKQMTALEKEGLVQSSSVVSLLENKLVLIVPKENDTRVSSFADVATDRVAMIGLGEPGSVPAGQYAEEIFTSLGVLDAVKAKANYGSDVRTVLSWVETAAVDCGVVYATDAFTSQEVRIVCEAPEGACKRVVYPVGIVAASAHPDEAAAWISFLQQEASMELFEAYGFSDARDLGEE